MKKRKKQNYITNFWNGDENFFQFIYLIWAIIGTWRSASKFKPKKKQWAWGTIAQVYIVLSVLRMLIGIATNLN